MRMMRKKVQVLSTIKFFLFSDDHDAKDRGSNLFPEFQVLKETCDRRRCFSIAALLLLSSNRLSLYYFTFSPISSRKRNPRSVGTVRFLSHVTFGLRKYSCGNIPQYTVLNRDYYVPSGISHLL